MTRVPPYKVYEVLQFGLSSTGPRYNNTQFEGICIDGGAQRSVCGITQAQAYCKNTTRSIRTAKTSRLYKFGDLYRKSLGTVSLRLPVPQGGFIDLDVDVVRADIPFLLGLDLLDANLIYANNVTNKLVNQALDWKMDIVRKH